MGSRTGIEWTDATWNPIRGCTRVSEGCRHCYAERVAARFSGPEQPYEGLAVMRNGEPRWTGEVGFIAEHLEDPLKWRSPKRVFVNSMSDCWHPAVSDEWLDKIFAIMARCPQHTFQILTKRPQGMLNYFTDPSRVDRIEKRAGVEVRTRWPLPNVWLGVSTENQAAADERIPLLLITPAHVRFISAEPLIGPIALGPYIYARFQQEPWRKDLHWVIVGGESGPGARPMHPHWAVALRGQCRSAGVAFFFKQWGEWAPITPVYDGDEEKLDAASLGPVCHAVDTHGTVWVNNDWQCDGQPPPGSWWMRRVGKSRSGRLLDGQEWNQMPGGTE